MEIKADSREFHEIECDALVVAVFEGEKPEEGVLAEIDKRSNGVISSLFETGELSGKSGESAYVHNPGNIKARRLLLLGVGKKEEFTTDAAGNRTITKLSPMRVQGWTVSAMWASASYLSYLELKREDRSYKTGAELAQARGVPQPQEHPATR